jgi:outer membrane protein assembly factor BamA
MPAPPARAGLLALAAAVTVLAAAVPGLAQPNLERLIGRPIASVSVVADGRAIEVAALRPLIDTRVGSPLDIADVRRTLRALVALGRFGDITVRAAEEGAGVTVTYDVTLIRRITKAAFDGDLGLPARRLRRAIAERFGSPITTARRAPEMSRVLAETLRQEGFLDARVTSRLEPTSATAATLVFDVAAGPRFRIGRVSVTGDPLDGAAKLEQRLRLGAGREWREADARARAEAEARRWRARGHYQAHIDLLPARREHEAVVDLRVDASPGPLVNLVFEGDSLPKARLADLVPVAREGAVDEDLLEDSKRRVEQYLRSQGYWKGTANYRREQSDARLRLVFSVEQGRLYHVGRLDLAGVDAADRERIADLLGLRSGRPFSEDVLDRDVASVQRYFQLRGYSQAKVSRRVAERAGVSGAPGLVDVEIAVEPGQRAVIGTIRLEGNSSVDEDTLRQVMQLRPAGPFFAPWLAADRQAVESMYRNRGFPDARVLVAAEHADAGPLANLTYRIDEGRQVVVQHVIVTGNERTSTDTILREARIVAGQPLGAQEMADAQRRLTALGLFRRVRVEAMADPGTSFRDVVIAVEENAATTVGYGAGLEGGRRLRREDVDGTAVEKLEFAPRGFLEVGRRNLWGKNRSVSLFSRASLRRKPDTQEEPDASGYGIYEYRVLGTFREPRTFGWNANATVSGLFEQAIRSSFSYRRRAVNADLSRRLAPDLTIGARYSWGYTNVYEDRSDPADKPLVDRLFPQVRLSIVAGLAAWDTRDDVFEPTRGHLVGLESDLATRALGSEVGFSKTFTQAFIYRQLPGSKVVFAGGARLGLATGFPRVVPVVDEAGNPVLDESGQPVVQTVKDLPQSERFYAGGDTTVRGFALDRLGDTDTIDQDGFPLGGDAVVIFNGELRFPVTRSLGGVVFVDAGNVFARVSQLDLSRIRATSGFGIRYKSPIGPLRIDLGFKLDPQRLPDGSPERRYELHISVGQAF